MFFNFSSHFLRVPLKHVTSGELTEQQRLEIISIIMEALLQKECRSLCKDKNFFLGKLGKLCDGSFLCLAQKGKSTQKWFESKEQIANILHNKITRIQEVANSLQEGVVWGSEVFRKGATGKLARTQRDRRQKESSGQQLVRNSLWQENQRT